MRQENGICGRPLTRSFRLFVFLNSFARRFIVLALLHLWMVMSWRARTYDWMISHRMLVGFGTTRIGSNWTYAYGEATIYLNATTIDYEVDGVRVSWNIVGHWTQAWLWSPMEFYKGESKLGSIMICISNELTMAIGPRFFFLGQLV